MKRIVSIIVCFVVLLTTAAYASSATTELQEMYAEAELLMAQGDYTAAGSKFEALGAYSDASQMAMYCKAVDAAESLGMYDVAVMTFANLGDFRDSKQMAAYYAARGSEAAADGVDPTTATDQSLSDAVTSYTEAEQGYGGLALFKDCLTRYKDCGNKRAVIEAEQARRAAEKYAQAVEADYQTAINLLEKGEYAQAGDIFYALGDYKDSKDRMNVCLYYITVTPYQAGELVSLSAIRDNLDALPEDLLEVKKYRAEIADLIEAADAFIGDYRHGPKGKEVATFGYRLLLTLDGFEVGIPGWKNQDSDKGMLYWQIEDGKISHAVGYGKLWRLKCSKGADGTMIVEALKGPDKTSAGRNHNHYWDGEYALTPTDGAISADTTYGLPLDNVFTFEKTIARAQQALNDLGYDCGTPDGSLGKKSQAAIRQYQTDKGLTITGTVTYELLISLGLMQ